MFKNTRDFAFVFSIAAAVLATVIICVCAASCSGEKLTYKSCYYFICYRYADNSVAVSSLSDAVASYGGAGYIICNEGNYYVTISCYYTERDAESVCSSLKRRDFDCFVLEVETESYSLKSYSAKKNKELYLGNLNTLNSLSALAYECANGLDTGELTQSKAKEIVASVKNGLTGLLRTNGDNCFTNNLNSLITECENRESGILLSKDMRYLQIAIIDAIINAELY